MPEEPCYSIRNRQLSYFSLWGKDKRRGVEHYLLLHLRDYLSCTEEQGDRKGVESDKNKLWPE